MKNYKKQNQEIINKLTEYFKNKENVILAILFGSIAQGIDHQHSDVDIAVHLTDSSINALIELQLEVSKICNKEADIVNLQTAKGLILSKIMEHGIKLKNKPNLFAQYNLKAIYFNEDFLPAIRMMQKAKRKRFLHGF